MNLSPELKTALLQALTAVEPVAEVAATAFGGPLAGAAVAAAEKIGNSALGAPVVVNTPPPVAPANQSPTVAQVAAAVPTDLSALTAQIAELKAMFAAQQASLSAAAPGAPSTHVDSAPGPGVQPFVTDPNAHPILVAAGRAPLVPPPVPAGPLDPNTASIGDIIACVNRVSSKLDALVEATGQGGSAAMAAHE